MYPPPRILRERIKSFLPRIRRKLNLRGTTESTPISDASLSRDLQTQLSRRFDIPRLVIREEEVVGRRPRKTAGILDAGIFPAGTKIDENCHRARK